MLPPPPFLPSFVSFLPILLFSFLFFSLNTSAMQVEYESSPIVEQPSFGEGVSFRPGSPQAGGAESEDEQDEEDAEAGEGPCLFFISI